MCETNISAVKDCRDKARYAGSILNLINADESNKEDKNEQIIENLASAVAHLDLAVEVLEALLRLAAEE